MSLNPIPVHCFQAFLKDYKGNSEALCKVSAEYNVALKSDVTLFSLTPISMSSLPRHEDS